MHAREQDPTFIRFPGMSLAHPHLGEVRRGEGGEAREGMEKWGGGRSRGRHAYTLGWKRTDAVKRH